MSDFQDKLKERIKQRSSAHDQLIDDSIPTSVDDDVDVKEHVNENVNVYPPRVSRRAKFEDKHTRATFYIENDLLEHVNRLAAGEKGEKTRIINDALRAYLKRRG